MESQNSRALRVGICIATFQRPHGLRDLLKALAGLSFRDGPIPSIVVVVADNDPESGEAARVCEEWELGTMPVIYTPEPRQGISYARNAAVASALGWGAELIAFVDDDEIPLSSWLDELLYVQARYGADAVAGPVLPDYHEGTPDWIIKGGFFERPRFETGMLVSSAPTGNLLVSVNCLDGGLPFSTNFAESGGEDTLFTMQLVRQGRRIVWADGAAVREAVPLHRTRTSYILSRAYGGGSSGARIEYLVRPLLATRVIRILKGLAHVVLGFLSLFPAVLAGRDAIVRAASHLWQGAGCVAGALGYGSRRYGVRT